MKKNNICFISNYYKTQVFVEIAKNLKEKNIETFWIVPNEKQYKALRELFPDNQLLYIGKKKVLLSEKKALSIDLKINELVYGDRVLKHESSKWTYNYLNKVGALYYDFIETNEISYVFGELTWAHELVAHRLLSQKKVLNCEYLNPHTVRIPNGRFAFFTNEFQSNILEASKKTDTKDDSSIKLEKPAYLALNDKLLAKKGTLSHSLGLLKNFIFRTNQDVNDPTLYGDPLAQFKIKTAEIYNRIVFKNFISETKVEALPKDKKRVLFTLHKQPEASIDVIGRYYEDQLDLIHNVWRILPEDHILLVKEHSNAIGDRNLGFYKSVKKLRNTYLIDNKADTHKLLDTISAVFTVSGTIAYEAALKEKHSFTFAPTFFNKLKCCKQVSWTDFRQYNLDDLKNKNSEGMVLSEFSNWLLKNSYNGIMSDAFGDPRSIESENINQLSKAFMTTLQ